MPPSLRSLASPLKIATHVLQPFGADPAWYASFLDTNGKPQKAHPGIDLYAPHGTPVYAMHGGHAIYLKDENGGQGVWNFSDSGFVTISWHLVGTTDANYPLPIPFDGVRHAVKAGDLIG